MVVLQAPVRKAYSIVMGVPNKTDSTVCRPSV